ATSTVNCGVGPSVSFSTEYGRRVHNSTLLLSGSPEATPSGKRSRRSRHAICDFAPNGRPQAAVAPMAAAIPRKERRVMADIDSNAFDFIFSIGTVSTALIRQLRVPATKSAPASTALYE